MREAIGATWIMGIVIVFIALFSAYLAFSINYTKAFRVKNGIVERIEKYNGFNDLAINDIKKLIDDIKYASTGNCKNVVSEISQTGGSKSMFVGVTGASVSGKNSNASAGEKSNYCIQKVYSKGTSDQIATSYYKAYVFFNIAMPIGDMSNWFFTTGETMTLSYPEEIPVFKVV